MTELPAGSPLPGTPGTGRGDAVSVAELLARHTAAAQDREATRHEDAGPLTGPVLSVGDLLRREGHGSATPAPADVAADGAPGGWPDIDLPQPRAAADPAGVGGWPARPTSGRRRAGAVAGVLVAAGSVLGAALWNGASSQDSDAQAAADGLFPGIGLPDAGAPDTLPARSLPATVALSSPLPATAPGAADWMGVAFPQQRTGSPGAAAGTLRAVSAGPGAAAAIPAQRVTSPPVGGGTAPAPSPTPTGPTGTGSPLGGLPPVQLLNDPDRPSAGNLLDPVTAPGPSAGGTGTGPLQDLTEPARPVTRAAGGALAPVARAAAPVGEAVGGAVTPLTDAARPATRALQPVTRPLTDTLEPVTTPVLGALSPATGPVLEGTAEPLTGPVLRSAEPVTALLDTSAQRSGPAAGTGGPGPAVRSSGDTQPLRAVTEPVGGVLGGVTGTTGSLLGGG